MVIVYVPGVEGAVKVVEAFPSLPVVTVFEVPNAVIVTLL